ncbi:hypothetical protein [Nocardiopsis sp. FR6]|uniref:hypothetical protein n=1 Tax=Nocardiopsis sp. FR6 TaxID=2605986 RepID=UPI0013576449|nr:hypothetical protein [Nocardiopsis sp. FR6]
METPAFDFRAALSGFEADPPVPEDPEQETGEEQQAEQEPRQVRSGSFPISIDLNTGMLLLRNGSGSVEVDTANREAVVRPPDPGADPGDGDLIVLRSLRAEERQQPTEFLQAQEALPHTPGAAPARTEAEPGPVVEGDDVPVQLAQEQVLRTVRVEEPQERDISGIPQPQTLHEHEHLLPRTETVAAEPVGTPMERAVAGDVLTYGGGTPRTESGQTGESSTPTEPVEAHTVAPPPEEGTDPDEEAQGEDARGEGPVVTVDPDTGETTVEVGDLRLVVDPERGTISVDPGDRDVPLDPESEPITVEAGNLRLTVDPERGTVVIEPLEPGEGTEGSEQFTIEIGDLRVTVDPETGEVTVDPGDGEVEVDPETGLVTITEPGRDQDSPTEGDRDGLPEDRRESSSDGGDEKTPQQGDTRGPGQTSGGSGSGGDQTGQTPLTPLTPTTVTPRTPAEETSEAGSPEEAVTDTPEDTVPGETVGGTSNTPASGEPYQGVVTEEDRIPVTEGTPAPTETLPNGGALHSRTAPGQSDLEETEQDGNPTPDTPQPVHTSSNPDPNPGTSHPAPDQDPPPTTESDGNPVPGETPADGVTLHSRTAPGQSDLEETEQDGNPTPDTPQPVHTSSNPDPNPGTSHPAPDQDPPPTVARPRSAFTSFAPTGAVSPGTESTGDGPGGGEKTDGDGSGSGSGNGGDEGTAIDLDRLTQFRDKFVVPLREEVSTMMMKFAKYGEASAGSESGGTGHLILLGNAKYLPIAGTVAGEIDTSMGTLYRILADMESELLLVEDRLSTNMRVFMDLEDEQKLTAEEVAAIIGTPSAGSGSGGGTTEKP